MSAARACCARVKRSATRIRDSTAARLQPARGASAGRNSAVRTDKQRSSSDGTLQAGRRLRQSLQVLLVVVDREPEECGDVEPAVCRMDAGSCPRRLVERCSSSATVRARASRKPRDEVVERRRRRDRARDLAPSTTSAARSSSRMEIRRADHTSRSTAIRWRTTSFAPHSPGAGAAGRRPRDASTASRAGKSAKDRTSVARVVTGGRSVLDAAEPSRTLLLLAQAMGHALRVGAAHSSRTCRTTFFSPCRRAARARIASLIVAASPLPVGRPWIPRMSSLSVQHEPRHRRPRRATSC